MSLDRAGIGQALRQWLATTTGLPDNKVIFSFQPGDVPQWPYISLNPSLATATSGVYDELVWSPGALTRIERRTITASVNVYGAQGQALPLADAACDGLESLAVTELLEAAGLSVIDKGSPHNLSELEQTQFVERIQFDVQFSAVAAAAAEDVGWIDSIGISGSLAAPGAGDTQPATPAGLQPLAPVATDITLIV